MKKKLEASKRLASNIIFENVYINKKNPPIYFFNTLSQIVYLFDY